MELGQYVRTVDKKKYYYLTLDQPGSQQVRRQVSKAAYYMVKKNQDPAFRQRVIDYLLQYPRSVRVQNKNLQKRGVNAFSAGKLPVLDPLRQAMSTGRRAPAGTLKRYLQEVVQLERQREKAVQMECAIPVDKVRNLLNALNVPVPPQPRRRRRSSCRALPSALQDACHLLARALFVSTLPSRLPIAEREEALRVMRPVRILGSGVAGFAFQLADRSVIKVVTFVNRRITGRIDPITKQEFLHEIRMLKHAKTMLSKTKTHVPEYLSHRVLSVRGTQRGRSTPDMGVLHMRAAPGVVLGDANFFSTSRQARIMGTALANIHNAGLIHGDLHRGNIMVDRRGFVTVIDWGRANTLAWYEKHDNMALYQKLLARDLAFSASRFRNKTMAALVIQSYLQKCKRCIPDQMLTAVAKNPRRYYEDRFELLHDYMQVIQRETIQAP